jgi:hypothetical protein
MTDLYFKLSGNRQSDKDVQFSALIMRAGDIVTIPHFPIGSGKGKWSRSRHDKVINVDAQTGYIKHTGSEYSNLVILN